ncbi:MAG: signal peptide peptidase SppA [Methylobacteriaceae bacterium]|nr:signal peptide peptidase SppA [Methylobacteriaceae bacterium]
MISGGVPETGSHIARVTIEGVIVRNNDMMEMIEKIGKDGNVKGVVLSIDSPGGSVVGSEDLYLALRGLDSKKPVVALINGIGASGSYIAAMAADHIVARETAVVGSIGVLMRYPNFGKLLETIGVEVDSIKSAPLKAEPSGVGPTPPEARESLQQVIDDAYTWFKNLVSQRRDLSPQETATVSDGRVFSAQKALSLKLIDATGTEKTAVEWLETKKNVEKGIPVKDWKPESKNNALKFLDVAARLAHSLGFELLSGSLGSVEASMDISQLDGILAIWHPTLER